MRDFDLKTQLTIRGELGNTQIKIVPICDKKFMLIEYKYGVDEINQKIINNEGLSDYLKSVSDRVKIHPIDVEKFLNHSTTNEKSYHDQFTD